MIGAAALGGDETAFLTANAKHPTIFVTGMVDLHGRRLLDVVPDRSSKALQDWVPAQPAPWRESISVAALDPFRGYATALTSSLPGAVRVLDAFQSPGSGSPPWTTFAAACNSRPLGIAAAAMTRSTGSAGCCAAARST